MRQIILSVVAALTFGWGTGARAESLTDFWIAPHSYNVAPGAPVIADLESGTGFDGTAQAFRAAGLLRFELLTAAGPQPVEGKAGALPAMSLVPAHEGLAVIVQESHDGPMDWTDWAGFERFVIEHGMDWAIEDHRDRGLSETHFQLSCLRFAKALVAVGNGVGEDRPVGLEAEIVALANPYADALGGRLTLAVLYQGKPLMQARLMVYARAPGGEVTAQELWTDTAGHAVANLQPGTEYMADAVILRPTANTGDAGPVWETLWASLTFRTPDDMAAPDGPVSN